MTLVETPSLYLTPSIPLPTSTSIYEGGLQVKMPDILCPTSYPD